MNIQRIILALVMGLGLGALVGAAFGWVVPFQDVSAEISDLHPEYKAEYTVMVAQAYRQTNNWDETQARLGRLAEPDTAGYIVTLTERFIAEGRSPEDIRALVRLSARYGFVTDAMRPYLSAEQ